MQDRNEAGGQDVAAGKVVRLSDWRAAHRPPPTAPGAAPPQRPATRVPAAPPGLSRSEAARLRGAVQRLGGAMAGLAQTLAQLEFRLHGLRRSFASASARLQAQKRQNDQVLACLESGDIEAMEECRRQIRAGCASGR